MATSEKTNNTPGTRSGSPKTSAEMPDKQRIAVLVVGDAIAFLVFAAIGRGSHGEASGLAAIPQIALTALPFAAAWFVIAPFVGAFRRDLTADPRKMAKRTVLAWLLSWPVAMALRGIFVDHGIPPLTFAIITLVFNTGILLVWRWPYALNNSIKRRS